MPDKVNHLVIGFFVLCNLDQFHFNPFLFVTKNNFHC